MKAKLKITDMSMEDRIIELLRKNRIGEEKAVYLAHELLFLLSVVGQSEQLKAVEKLKDFAYEVCPLHREDDLEEIVGSL